MKETNDDYPRIAGTGSHKVLILTPTDAILLERVVEVSVQTEQRGLDFKPDGLVIGLPGGHSRFFPGTIEWASSAAQRVIEFMGEQ